MPISPKGFSLQNAAVLCYNVDVFLAFLQQSANTLLIKSKMSVKTMFCTTLNNYQAGRVV